MRSTCKLAVWRRNAIVAGEEPAEVTSSWGLKSRLSHLPVSETYNSRKHGTLLVGVDAVQNAPPTKLAVPDLCRCFRLPETTSSPWWVKRRCG